ncbi:MAG: hypothetical protein WCK95_11300 [Alphaproteobacteria bacterium]
MNGKQFLELLARLPARVWLQAILGLIGFVVLAVLGFAVIAGVAAIVLIAILGFKAKAWIASLFGRTPTEESPHQRETRQVTDVQYEIVEKKDDTLPR